MRIFVFSTGLLALTVGGGVGLSMAHQAAFPTVGPMPTVSSPAPETMAFAVHRTTVPGAASLVEQAAVVQAPSVIGQEPARVEQAVLRSPSPVSRGDHPATEGGEDLAQEAILDDNDFIDRGRDTDGGQRETIVMRSDPTDFVRTAPVSTPSHNARTGSSNDLGNLTLIGVYR